MNSDSRKTLSRRRVLSFTALGAGAALALAACGETRTVEVDRIVTKEVPVEKIVEKEVLVEKIVVKEVTKIVERVVVEQAPLQRPPRTIRFTSKFTSGARNEYVTWLKDNFEKENAWADIKLETISGADLWDKLAAMFAAGTDPDVMLVFKFVTGNWMPKGVFHPIDAFLQKYDWNWNDYYSMDPYANSWRDEIYAVPNIGFVASLGGNMERFDELGIAYPADNWSWEDFREAAAQGTGEAGGGKVWGYGMGWYNMLENFEHFVRDNGGRLVSEDRRASLFNTPEALEAISFVSNLQLKDQYMPEATDIEALKGAGINPWYSGRILMQHTVFNGKPGWNKNATFAWDYIPWPTKGEHMPLWRHDGMYLMGQNARDHEAAWLFMQFAAGDPGQEQLGVQEIGIPTKIEWSKDPNGFIKAPPAHATRAPDDTARSFHSPASFPGYQEWRRAVEAQRELMIAGELSVEEAMNEATRVGDELMDKNWAEVDKT